MQKRNTLLILLLIQGFLVFYFILTIIFQSRSLSHSKSIINSWLSNQEYHVTFMELKQQALQRVSLYEEDLNRFHLKQGMVVNRTTQSQYLDVCDSLLFSSLRYTALHKLHLHQQANQAWEAINRSKTDGNWVRHPLCSQKPISRDMILGLLVALSQRPPGADQIIHDLIVEVKNNYGFLEEDPDHVGYITPNIGKLLNQFINFYQLDWKQQQVPATVQYGFSTAELDSLVVPKGYQLHLIALNAWIELELEKSPTFPEYKARSIIQPIFLISSAFTIEPLMYQRLDWITFNLTRQDPQNLFFLYLRLKSMHLLTESTRTYLLAKLLEMPQFPPDRLPQNCDRKADYLWQRDSYEYTLKSDQCTMIFSGVDFTFLVALLLEDSF